MGAGGEADRDEEARLTAVLSDVALDGRTRVLGFNPRFIKCGRGRRVTAAPMPIKRQRVDLPFAIYLANARARAALTSSECCACRDWTR